MSIRIVVIGAGFGGLGAVHALTQAGLTDVTVLERADEVGGVWRDNTYPGAACDVPSPLYSWSWAVNPGWTRRYARQPEILDYLRGTAERAGLLAHVRTGVEVTALSYDEAECVWHVETADGTTYDAEVVVSAVGQLSNPAIPRLPGAETFAGPAFHSAQWRHDVDLRGARVAVVGTGASAIQLVPGIVDDVAAMTVFQRSAPYVIPKPDQGYRPVHHRAFERFPWLLAAERRSWFWLTELYNAALGGVSPVSRPLLATVRAVWRLTLRRQVTDPELRRRLVPEYRLGCKRLLFSNDWYPALARDHVDVVTDAVAEVEPGGVRTADGRLHEADVLIWGTGFAATEFLAPMRVTGVGGADLHDLWRDGARAHLGMSVPGFPQLFCIYGPNTNLGGSSIIAMMEAQAGYVAEVARRLADGGPRALAVRPEVAQAYDREMQSRLRRSAWAGCDNWYADGTRITTNWPGLVDEYRARTAHVDWDELEDVAR
ncbi:NAD(P)/FAD-dependent oxidoreductase [Nocardioides sp. cx-173]|uniref:flavin-containing monooxygenase n=1 Tax=Nocardioides sp. cx-173 TaxID=2898796 RepID=UPI001E559349|nr:NAD(P)/FAD-dependent oxidoreductase [Nocardioides sp. cx-173]MCD4526265.1 NAD(P)/FAD-dependent oxidoreductase [Nocardioides sp. cx-173]UGB40526.1 NAD(P)/FAD-dependent oxidoreductase [Nocardioides sp. cx-173]